MRLNYGVVVMLNEDVYVYNICSPVDIAMFLRETKLLFCLTVVLRTYMPLESLFTLTISGFIIKVHPHKFLVF